MAELRFGRDPAKTAANIKKHGIGFDDEAKPVFADERAKLIADPQHSDDEDRFVLPGPSTKLELPVGYHCYHSNSNTIRTIPAGKATAKH